MIWMAVCIDFEDDPKVEQIDGFARALLQYIWRRAKRNDVDRGKRVVVDVDDGFIKIDRWDSKYLASKTGFKGFEKEIKGAMSQLIEVGLVVLADEYVTIPNWRKYQKKIERAHGQKKIRESRNVPVETVKKSAEPKKKLTKYDKSPFRADAEKLAEFLKKKISEYKPDYPSLKKSDTHLKWSKVFEAMLRIDKREPRKIAEVIKWVAETSDFWKPNILSAKKLREKIDQIELQMDADANKSAAVAGKPKKLTAQDKINELGKTIKRAMNGRHETFSMQKLQTQINTAVEDGLNIPDSVSKFLSDGQKSGCVSVTRLGKIAHWDGADEGTIKEIFSKPKAVESKDIDKALDNLPPEMKARMAFNKENKKKSGEFDSASDIMSNGFKVDGG
jgi:hypothetical protein